MSVSGKDISILNNSDSLDSLNLKRNMEKSETESFIFFPNINPFHWTTDTDSEEFNNIVIHRTSEIFKVNKNKKRGRNKNINDNSIEMDKNKSIKVHSKSAFDNVQTKLQVHFINFLINFSNDAINTEFNNNKKIIPGNFKHINYKDKKKIEHDHLQRIILKPIKDIIILDLSRKYSKNFDLKYNKNLYDKLIAKSEWLESFLDMKFIEAFSIYYNNGKSLTNVNYKDKNIIISHKTKSFYYLLYKEENLKKEIYDTANSVYLNRINHFMIQKNEISVK